MKIFKLNIGIAILLCSLAFICQAADKYNLYSATVPVESQQAGASEIAMQQALAQVFTKLSGSTVTIAIPTPAQASQWVLQYRYEADGLNVTFDQKAVDNYLKKNNITIWSGDRPLTLVWMAVEENGTQAIVGEYETGLIHWQQMFTKESKARGVPVLFPLLDLTDKQQVELNDVWYHVDTALKGAATRYQAENSLSGRIYKNSQTAHWSADWLLALPTEQVGWQNEASTPEELIKASVNRFANELAVRVSKSTTPTSVSALILTIENVNDVHSYLRVMSYLHSLNALDTITPTEITPTTVSVQVKLKMPVASFEQQVATGLLLQSIPSTDEHVLHYRYL